jgi:hypothetical protein
VSLLVVPPQKKNVNLVTDPQNFQKFESCLKLTGARRAARSKVHTEVKVKVNVKQSHYRP